MTIPMPSSPALAIGAPFLTVGLDVGGTKTACVVTDADDRILLHEVVPTDATRLPAQLSELIRSAVDRFPSSATDGSDGTGGASVGAVGVAVPGHVEPDSGTIRLAVNLGGG